MEPYEEMTDEPEETWLGYDQYDLDRDARLDAEAERYE